VKFAVESWSPDYGAPTDDDVLLESEVAVDCWVECSLDEWRPRAPAPFVEELSSAMFVDGIRRIEANVWITGDDGAVRQGICASYAAGAVRCDGVATLVAAEVRRGLFSPIEGAGPVVTEHGTFPFHPAPTDDPVDLSLLLQRRMGELERQVAAGAPPAQVIVIDGPLKLGQEETGVVGFVKTHRRSYGEQIVRDVVGALAAGQRTPLLLVDTGRPRFSWYLRLPCQITHGWAGVVRLETTADQSLAQVTELADQLCVTLPRFASVPQKDPRAPQNLVPIGGLERELRRRLGDPHLLIRGLRAAAGHAA
jgi:uncharacterized protein